MNAAAPHVESQELRSRCAAVELLVLDVDGVLTDGSIWLDERGREVKRFHVRDGFAMKHWQRAGGRIAILTGRVSVPLARRCRELGVDEVTQGSPVKGPALERLLTRMGVDAQHACYVGDDVPDAPAITRCGVGFAVADAAPEAISAADRVLSRPGGHGAVREAIETLLEARGAWRGAVGPYLDAGRGGA